MPTPSSDLYRPVATRPDEPDVAFDTGDSGDTLRFRAPTLEEAIALAESSLGARVRVVAANRIRRGGIGGFFASDLGVEVTVALDDETMEEALERLVAESAAPDPTALQDERARFADRLAAQLLRPSPSSGATSSVAPGPRPSAARPAAPAVPAAPIAPAAATTAVGSRFDRRDDEPAPAVNTALAEVLAALVTEAALRQALVDAAADDTDDAADDTDDAADDTVDTDPMWPVGARAVADREPAAPVLLVGPDTSADLGSEPNTIHPPTMLRVEQIMAELSAITAEPVFGSHRRPRVARPAAPDAAAATVAVTPTDAAPAADRPRVLPTLPPRPSEVARRAADSARAAQTEYLAAASARSVLATPSSPPTPASPATPVLSPAPVLVDVDLPSGPDRDASAVLSGVVDPIEPFDGAPGTDSEQEALVVSDQGRVHADVEIDASQWPGSSDHRSGVPSQRQVELAVAATDQLIDSLTREPGVKRLTVRVVLRTGDHREVAAEAEWEAS
jgi:hypothetical protein